MTHAIKNKNSSSGLRKSVLHASLAALAVVSALSAQPTMASMDHVAVSYIGSPANDIQIINGGQKGVTLSDALKQITPAGWHAYLKENLTGGKFDKNRKVNWTGGRPWVDVLDILANDQNLFIEIDWDKKSIYIGDMSKAQPDEVATPAVKANPLTAAAVAPAPIASPIAAPWVASQGSTLRNTINAWAKTANWEVYWDQDVDFDYPIEVPIQFTGSFINAITGLFEHYRSAPRSFLVDGYKNRVIVISEKKR